MTVVEWPVPRKATANAMVASVADDALVRATVLQSLASASRQGKADTMTTTDSDDAHHVLPSNAPAETVGA